VSITAKAIQRTIVAALPLLGAAVFAGSGFASNLRRQIKPCHPRGAANALVTTRQSRQTPQNPSETKRNDRTNQAAPGDRTGRREENKKPPDSSKYSYEFTQPQFYIRHILIEHDASGRGKIVFERQGEETPVTEPIELSTGALGRILGLWATLAFLDSTENYQSDKQFPHLGTMRLRMEHDARNRTAEFNWTNNRNASALVNEYRRVADQAVFVFDVSLARENQPLNAPKLMEELEMLINRNGISDAQQLLPLLREISTDEHLPLIARNHAGRLLKRIEK
jgi:hypothetical protein